MNIDGNGALFECAGCNKRFHRVGFQPSEIDASVSLSASDNAQLNIMLQRT